VSHPGMRPQMDYVPQESHAQIAEFVARGYLRFDGIVPNEINRLGIGRKFQTPSVYIDHTVFENVMLSLKGPRGVFA